MRALLQLNQGLKNIANGQKRLDRKTAYYLSFKGRERESVISYLGINFLKTGLFFIYLKIHFRGGDGQSAFHDYTRGHELSWCA